MKCPPALLAATFLLQVAIIYWKFICLIEDTKPNWENLASLGKTGAAFFEGGAWRIGACPLEWRIVLTRRAAAVVPSCREYVELFNVGVVRPHSEKGERK